MTRTQCKQCDDRAHQNHSGRQSARQPGRIHHYTPAPSAETLPEHTFERGTKAFLFTRQMRPGDFVEQAFIENLREFQAFCERRSIIAGQTFREYGSGDAPLQQRPILQEAIELSKDNVLVVERLDRLSTRKHVLQEIFDECARNNVRLEPIFGPRTLEQILTLVGPTDSTSH